jgi:uncharacterized repeat protein (TIGR01451 family)
MLPLPRIQAGENTWTVSGPPGGYFRDLEASPTDPKVFYAAYGRSFFHTSDGAATWQAREFVHEVVDIAVDPTDGTRVYVAALEDGLYRSEDGGLTFTQIAPGDTLMWAVGVGGADGKTVYYATGNGSFYQSTDRGQTFVSRPLTALGISQIRVEGANGLSILAVRGNVLAQSQDGGASWSEAPVDGTNFIQSITRLGSGTLVATTQGGVFTSSDGVAWTRSLTGTFYAAAADPANPAGVIVANYGGGRLYRNTNNGDPASWTSFGTPPPLGTPSREIVTSGPSSELILANTQGVQVSLDGGTTWQDASSGLNASDSTRMASTVGANARVYAYTDSAYPVGLFSTSTDNGWLRLNLNGAQALSPSVEFGQATLAVKPGAPLTLYIGAFNAGMFRTDDGGATWSGPGTGLNGLSPNAIAFDPVDSNIMYASVSQGSQTPAAALYRSTDGGATWSPRSADLPNAYGLRLAVQPADGTHMFLATTTGLAGERAGLYGSTDAGVHWSLVALGGQTVHDVALDPADSNRVYAAADASGLNVSSDGGVTFTPNAALTAITRNPVVAVTLDPVISTTIYVATVDPGVPGTVPQSSYILRSVDRGQTWETLRSATDQPTWFVSDLMLDPNVPSLLYAGTGGRGIGAFEIVNDLAVSISGHSGVKPEGLPATFDVSVQNNGGLSATGVHVAVQLPTGLTNVSATVPTGNCTTGINGLACDVAVIGAGQSSVVHVTYTPPGVMDLPVSATVSAHERDNVATNNSAQASASSGEVVDLRVSASSSAPSPAVGDTFTYTVQVSNAGPLASSSATLTFAPASGVSLAGTAPSGCSVSNGAATCTLASLAVGASQTFAFSATANAAGRSVATATVAPARNATDADQSNNSSQATVTVSAAASHSSGGGGALDALMLLAMAGVVGLRGWRMKLV